MDPHVETMIQNEEATLSLSEDAISPPKKRGKHVSDSDSPEKKHISDVGLSEQEPALTSDEWDTMFEFQYYKPGPPQEALEAMFTKCTNEFEALREKYNKDKVFSDNLFKELKKSAMDDYIKFRDGELWELKLAEDEYYKKIEELALMPNVDKLMEVLLSKVNNFELIEKCSRLTSQDILRITFYVRTKKGIEFHSGEEANINAFYESGVKEVADGYKDSVEHIHSLLERFLTAAAIVNENSYRRKSQSFNQVGSLVSGLQMAGVYSRIIDVLLELLRTKDVIAQGYDDDFLDDWHEALRAANDIDPTFFV